MFKREYCPTIPKDEMVITARHLSVEVGSEHPLTDVSLMIHPGEHVAITGPSGSGKTTLANYIVGLSIDNKSPAQGAVYYNETSIYDLTKDQRGTLRGTLFGYVPQAPHLFSSMSVLDNITINARKKKMPVDQKNLADLVELMGLEDKLDRIAGTLSGGEQQRVSIVRALAHDPAAVILDEPTSALNTELKQEVNWLLEDLAEEKDTTIIVISHEQTSASRIIHLEDGYLVHKIASQGNSLTGVNV